MANGTQLNERLQSVEKKYKVLYKSFMDICLHSTTEEMQDNHELLLLFTHMKKHSELTVMLIKELMSQASPAIHECNLAIYEKLYENNDEMLLSYTDIESSPELKETYLTNGHDTGAFALATAHNWIMHTCELE